MKKITDLVYTLKVRIRADLIDDLHELQEGMDIMRAVASVDVVDVDTAIRDARPGEVEEE